MYNQTFRPRRSSTPGFSRHSFKRNTKRQFTGHSIDVNKFIRKADTTRQTVEYQAQHTFADFALHPILKANILAKGYTTPTAIQDKTIPQSLNGGGR